jgi:hypothetical protein
MQYDATQLGQSVACRAVLCRLPRKRSAHRSCAPALSGTSAAGFLPLTLISLVYGPGYSTLANVTSIESTHFGAYRVVLFTRVHPRP